MISRYNNQNSKLQSEVAKMSVNSNMPERWISLQEACDHLGVKRYTIMEWIKNKNMPAVRVGRFWKF